MKFNFNHATQMLQMLQHCSKICMDYWGNLKPLNTKIKSDNSPLTQADEAINAIICKFIRQKLFTTLKCFDNLCLISEEASVCSKKLKDGKSEISFFVDPIDGTRDFIKKTTNFTINIGICINNKPCIGFVVAPALGECYFGLVKKPSLNNFIDYASFGSSGAFCCENFHKISNINLHYFTKINPSRASEGLVLAISKNPAEQGISKYFTNVSSVLHVSSSLKGCLLASGKAHIYCRQGPTYEWDTCAIHALALAVKCFVKNLDGTNLVYNKYKQSYKNVKGFCMANKKSNLLKIKNENQHKKSI